MNVRKAELSDAGQLADIYNFFIQNSHATFEIDPVTAGQMEDRIRQALGRHPFLVFRSGDQLDGYSYGHDFRPRPAYENTVEISVYVRSGMENRGIGRALYGSLLDEISNLSFHTIIAGISLPNEASIKLHESFGFKKVAHFAEVGCKFNRWIDVGYWQRPNSKTN